MRMISLKIRDAQYIFNIVMEFLFLGTVHHSAYPIILPLSSIIKNYRNPHSRMFYFSIPWELAALVKPLTGNRKDKISV